VIDTNLNGVFLSALDTGLRENMRKAVARVLQIAGITAVLVTHDQAEALSFADQVAVLREGRLIQAGTPQALYLNPRDRETALFLGDAIILAADLDQGLAKCVLGQIPVGAGNRQGRTDIMLRPEQLRLRAIDEAGAGAACIGKVTEIEFGGAVCAVTVVLSNGSETLNIRSSGVGLPEVGSMVSVSVIGKAHVFDRLDS